LGRLRKVEHGEFLVQFGRDFHYWRHQHDGLETVFEMKGDVLEFADDGEVVFGQEGMKILEQKNGRLNLLDDLVEGSQRVAGGAVALLVGLDGGAGWHEAVRSEERRVGKAWRCRWGWAAWRGVKT